MLNHTRVLEAEAEASANALPDPRLAAHVCRQFEAPHPRRVTLPRYMNGADLGAVADSQAMIRATGQGRDRIHCATERDLAVAFLVDCPCSIEAATGDHSVIDTARDLAAALASGLDKLGDRLGI